VFSSNITGPSSSDPVLAALSPDSLLLEGEDDKELLNSEPEINSLTVKAYTIANCSIKLKQY
jgi:hypothetical protein